MRYLEDFYGLPCYFVKDGRERDIIANSSGHRSFVACCARLKKGGHVILLFEEYYMLPAAYRRFVLYHEAGHAFAGNAEEAANRWALEHYPGNGRKAMEVLYGLTPWVRTETRKRLGLPPKEVAPEKIPWPK